MIKKERQEKRRGETDNRMSFVIGNGSINKSPELLNGTAAVRR